MPRTKVQSPGSALIIVDMTNDFLLKSYNESLALERGLELVPRIRELEDFFLNSNHPVIYSTDRHLKSDFELKRWGPHSMKGTDGFKDSSTVCFRKNPRSAYWREIGDLQTCQKSRETSFCLKLKKGLTAVFLTMEDDPPRWISLLKKLGFKPGDRLFITGLHTNCCDKHTAADAFFRGFITSNG